MGKTHKSYYTNLGYSEQEAEKMASEYRKSHSYMCIEYYERLYPGKTREEYLKLRELKRCNRRDNSGVKNPGHRSRTTLLERRQRSPMCIEFYIHKYPQKSIQECEVLLKQHRDKIKSSHTPENTSTRVEYWMQKGYSREDAQKLISERQKTFNLQKCITKYGEEEGRKRYKNRQIKWQKSLRDKFVAEGYNGIHQSKFANSIIDVLEQYFPSIQREYNIGAYSFDLCLNKKLIEFNGDYWHMNPNIFDPTDVNKTSKKQASLIWESDANKIKEAQRQGYDVYVVWEQDYKKDPIGVISKCKEFLQ